MYTYISILRGINVGGKNIVKMPELKELYAKLGFTNIVTFIQSGNVVFRAKKFDTNKLTVIISTTIAQSFGFNVPVIVMELNELQKIVKENPFATDKTKATEFLHVTFLSDIPKAEESIKISHGNYTPDEFHLLKNAIYLYCPGGYSKSKLSNGFLEKKLNVTATTRNWKTTQGLLIIGESLK